jgi:hypothetical protein
MKATSLSAMSYPEGTYLSFDYGHYKAIVLAENKAHITMRDSVVENEIVTLEEWLIYASNNYMHVCEPGCDYADKPGCQCFDKAMIDEQEALEEGSDVD